MFFIKLSRGVGIHRGGRPGAPQQQWRRGATSKAGEKPGVWCLTITSGNMSRRSVPAQARTAHWV